MEEVDEVKPQDDATKETTSATRKQAARRKFLRQAIAATSGVVLARQWFLGPIPVKAALQTACTPASSAFTPVGELTSRDGRLRAVLCVRSGSRICPPAPQNLCCDTMPVTLLTIWRLRYGQPQRTPALVQRFAAKWAIAFKSHF